MYAGLLDGRGRHLPARCPKPYLATNDVSQVSGVPMIGEVEENDERCSGDKAIKGHGPVQGVSGLLERPRATGRGG